MGWIDQRESQWKGGPEGSKGKFGEYKESMQKGRPVNTVSRLDNGGRGLLKRLGGSKKTRCPSRRGCPAGRLVTRKRKKSVNGENGPSGGMEIQRERETKTGDSEKGRCRGIVQSIDWSRKEKSADKKDKRERGTKWRWFFRGTGALFNWNTLPQKRVFSYETWKRENTKILKNLGKEM